MTPPRKTPGIDIEETSAFPNSIAAVATAVPAFIGYTEKAEIEGMSLANKPWRIASLVEFQTYFGGPPSATAEAFAITMPAGVENSFEDRKAAFAAIADELDAAVAAAKAAAGVANGLLEEFRVEHEGARFLLYYGMVQFFQNGGGPCYIISVGEYGTAGIEAAKLTAGIELLLQEQEPSLIVIPDAVQLADADACAEVQAQALSHCFETKRRFAILDVFNGDQEQTGADECVKTFREKLPTEHLDYAAAYYPWLNTSVVGEKEVSYKNVDPDGLTAVLKAESAVDPEVIGQVKTRTAGYSDDELQNALIAGSPVFARVMQEVRRQINVLPPSAAVAGVYATVDSHRGVWKAPANVALNSVVSPTVTISNADLALLNVDLAGNSINAIRAFPGSGVLVWGARTLDGNSPDWRYVNVRRTGIFLEQSIEGALRTFVFEENTPATWAAIKSMIVNFLSNVWKSGGLQGASSEDAFGVDCGLGETMTADDVRDGILKIQVLVAMTRPAEFTVMVFERQVQMA
jgi:uncharacterized protein